MPRELLSVQHIKKLNTLLRELFEHISLLKNKDELAKNIKYPQIPSTLTESLAIHLLQKKIIIPELEEFHFSFGGRTADVLGTKHSQQVTVEVKATAKSAFQYFSEKDISCDYLIWIHFSEFYMNSKDTCIEVYTLKKPGNYFKKPLKITLSKLKEEIGKNLKKTSVDIHSL